MKSNHQTVISKTIDLVIEEVPNFELSKVYVTKSLIKVYSRWWERAEVNIDNKKVTCYDDNGVVFTTKFTIN